MMDKSFIEAIRAPEQAAILKDSVGREYSNVTLENLPHPDQFAFPKIELCTLAGLVDYVTDNRDGSVGPMDCQIICTARNVNLFTEPKGVRRSRDFLVGVSAPTPKLTFDGSYKDLESFRIDLLTKFEDSPEQDKILAFIAKVSDEAIKTSTDDGVTQTVTARVGLAGFATAQVPSPILLAPMRTFTEIDQPASNFVFRMKRDEKQGILAALFYIADDWEAKAARDIRAWLRGKLSGYTILA